MNQIMHSCYGLYFSTVMQWHYSKKISSSYVGLFDIEEISQMEAEDSDQTDFEED